MSRHVLMDATADDAGPLLKALPQLVAESISLWDALPNRPILKDGPVDIERRSLEARLPQFNHELAHSPQWVRRSQPDPRIHEMTTHLKRITQLVTLYGPGGYVRSTKAYNDAEATRVRLMHIVYVTAHATGVSLIERQREATDLRRSLLPPYEAHLAEQAHARALCWLARVQRLETFAHSYINGRYVSALAHEVPAPREDPGRLHRMLAHFDAVAHRVLAEAPSPAEIQLISHIQGMTSAAATQVLPVTGVSDAVLLDRVEQATVVWAEVAHQWSDLVVPPQPLSPELIDAASHVRTALRQITHDRTRPATNEVLLDRGNLHNIKTGILFALEQGDELADVIADAGANPDLVGPAKTMSIRAQNLYAEAAPRGQLPDIVWVLPIDVYNKRLVPLPKPVADRLLHSGKQLKTISGEVSASAIRASQPTHGVEPAKPRVGLAPLAEIRREAMHLTTSRGERHVAAPR